MSQFFLLRDFSYSLFLLLVLPDSAAAFRGDLFFIFLLFLCRAICRATLTLSRLNIAVFDFPYRYLDKNTALDAPAQVIKAAKDRSYTF
jgi:hypothetical protein